MRTATYVSTFSTNHQHGKDPNMVIRREERHSKRRKEDISLIVNSTYERITLSRGLNYWSDTRRSNGFLHKRKEYFSYLALTA